MLWGTVIRKLWDSFERPSSQEQHRDLHEASIYRGIIPTGPSQQNQAANQPCPRGSLPHGGGVYCIEKRGNGKRPLVAWLSELFNITLVIWSLHWQVDLIMSNQISLSLIRILKVMPSSATDNAQETKVLGSPVKDRDLSPPRRAASPPTKAKKSPGKQQDKSREPAKQEQARAGDEYEDDFEETQEFVSSFEEESKFVLINM